MKKHEITLQLSEEDGLIDFNENDEVNITYQGYNYMNNIINASVHMPDTILVDGVEKENPYVVTNGDGEILEVTALAVAFCKFNGNVVSASASVKMNVEMYLTNELMQLVSKDRTAGHLVKKGFIELKASNIARSINDELEIVVNLTNNKVVNIFSDYTENKARGERRIISIAQRNALKKLPPFAVPLKNIVGMPGNRVGEVTLSLYGAEDDERVIDVLANAKSINARIMTRDLIDIDTGEIIEVGDVANLSSIEKAKTEVNSNEKTDEKATTTKTTKRKNSKDSKVKDQQTVPDSKLEKTEATDKNEVDKERAELIARYNKVPKEHFSLAAELLYPNKDTRELASADIKRIIIAAEKML